MDYQEYQKPFDTAQGKQSVIIEIRAGTGGDEAGLFVRDLYTCQHCAQHGGTLEAHHIKPWVSFPALRFEIDNGITLCVPCHKAEHRRMRSEK